METQSLSLTVAERVRLLDILATGKYSFGELKAVRRLKTELLLTDEEVAAINFRAEDGMWRWDRETAEPVEIEIVGKARIAVNRRLRELDEASDLGDQDFSLAEKILEYDGDEEEAGGEPPAEAT